MYTEKDYADIRAQLHRRLLALGLPALLAAAGIIVVACLRIQWLAMVGTLLLGCYAIFCYGMLLQPVIAYGRHLKNVLHGRVRTLTGAFKEMEENNVIRDGVHYYPMLLNVGNMESMEDDRLFYFDANLPRPDWKRGEMLTIISHDKAVGAWERAGEDAK